MIEVLFQEEFSLVRYVYVYIFYFGLGQKVGRAMPYKAEIGSVLQWSRSEQD